MATPPKSSLMSLYCRGGGDLERGPRRAARAGAGEKVNARVDGAQAAIVTRDSANRAMGGAKVLISFSSVGRECKETKMD